MKNCVITIAREFGSGGKTIGKMIADELGIPFYDREILRLASDDSGINESLFAKADEKMSSTPLFKIANRVYTGELIPPDSDDFVSNDNLFNYQAKIIKELAAQGPCVIVGRCADFVLKDNDNVIRLFVHSTPEKNLKTVCELKGLEEKEAQKLIDKTNKHRAAYYKCYTGRDWDNAKNYDLCLDSSRLTYEKCVQIVKAYIDIR